MRGKVGGNIHIQQTRLLDGKLLQNQEEWSLVIKTRGEVIVTYSNT